MHAPKVMLAIDFSLKILKSFFGEFSHFMRKICLLPMSSASASASTSMLSSMERYAQRFLLFDYRLNVIKRILIYVLITKRIYVEANTNDTDKSTSSSTTATTTTRTRTIKEKMSKTKTTTASSKNHQRTTALTMFAAFILLLNRTSSAIFTSDDTAVTAAIAGGAHVVAAAAVLPTINVFDANNFGIETMNSTNQNAKEFRKRNKRSTHDDLLATTMLENTTASTMQTTMAAAMAKLSTASKILTPTTTNTSALNSTAARVLSRSKRFLTFPEGSSFSVAVCFTVGIIGNPRYDYMAFGLNWGVAYDLPNSTWVINHLHGSAHHPVPAAVLRRRTRRALYKEIELVVDNMGYNGRDCVLRALCESRQYFSKNKLSMIGEMMRVVFSLPKQRIFTRELHENSEIEVYDRAYRRARDISCEQQYDCTFSLLELAFGKYSTPPAGYYQ